MAQTFVVTLNANGELEVEDIGVERDTLEDITWKLSDDTLQGAIFSFHPLDWIKKPAWYIFSKPEVSSDRRQMTIQDKHQGSGTTGSFLYQLHVERIRPNGTREQFDTTKYDTKSNSRLSNNPVIINR
jgi:hypothetical protein